MEEEITTGKAFGKILKVFSEQVHIRSANTVMDTKLTMFEDGIQYETGGETTKGACCCAYTTMARNVSLLPRHNIVGVKVNQNKGRYDKKPITKANFTLAKGVASLQATDEETGEDVKFEFDNSADCCADLNPMAMSNAFMEVRINDLGDMAVITDYVYDNFRKMNMSGTMHVLQHFQQDQIAAKAEVRLESLDNS